MSIIKLSNKFNQNKRMNVSNEKAIKKLNNILKKELKKIEKRTIVYVFISCMLTLIWIFLVGEIFIAFLLPFILCINVIVYETLSGRRKEKIKNRVKKIESRREKRKEVLYLGIKNNIHSYFQDLKMIKDEPSFKTLDNDLIDIIIKFKEQIIEVEEGRYKKIIELENREIYLTNIQANDSEIEVRLENV